MKISIIGLGGIAKKYYLPILSTDAAYDLQILARTPDLVQKTQAEWKISETATTLEEVVKWKPDAAFVLTNSVAHYEIVRQLILKGIDVFVEKPATLHTDQTSELAELAQSNERICMVGFNRRFAPIHQRGKEYWGNRKIELAEFTKLRTKPFHDDVRSHLYDDTIHLLDTMRFYCGEAQLAHRELHVEDQLITCAGIFELQAGGIAIVKNSMRCGEWRENYILSGDGLTLELEAFARISIFQGDEQRSWKENYASGNDLAVGRGFRGEIEHFLNCVKTRKQPETDLFDSVKTQKLVEDLAGD